MTEIHHFNFRQNVGEIDGSIHPKRTSGSEWRPQIKMKEVIESIYQLFSNPLPQYSQNENILKQYQNNYNEWLNEAKLKTVKFAGIFSSMFFF